MELRRTLAWILFVFASSAISENVPCGTRGERDPTVEERIVGGLEAKKGDWPWQALLMYHRRYRVAEVSPRRVYGGGSVISDRWILTAAHIFDNAILSSSFKTKSWNTILVILGLTDYPKVGDKLEESAFVFEPVDVIRHENYDSKTYNFDIALIKFGKAQKILGPRFVPDASVTAIPFGTYIRPVCLPCMNSCDKGGGVSFNEATCKEFAKTIAPPAFRIEPDAVVTGYGSTVARDPLASNFKYPNTLQYAEMVVLNDANCNEGLKEVNKVYSSIGHNVIAQYTDQMICALGIGKAKANISDSCQGDSGGPLVKQVNTSTGSCWTQIGIVSWGLGCASRPKDGGFIPGYYVNVASLMGWVLEKIGRRKKPLSDSVQCPSSVAPRNGHFVGNSKDRYVESVLTIACSKGYTLKGKPKSKCLPTGRWEPFPKCEGSPSGWGDWSPWSTCSATCRGRQQRNRVCTDKDCSGRNKDMRLCNRLGCLPMCEPVKAPLHGSMKVTPNADVFSPGTVVAFSCDDNWNLAEGPAFIQCQPSEEWSDKRKPVCEEFQCPAPQELANGKITGSKFKVGSTIKFRCKVGYKLRGSKDSNCDSRGQWTGGKRTCEQISCRKPRVPANAIISGDKYTSGSRLVFSCKDGYSLKGGPTGPFAICSTRGRWPRFPRCVEVSQCKEPVAPSNGRVIGEKRQVGSTIRFSCDERYIMKGSGSSKCGSNKQWGPFPKCEATRCPDPVAPNDGIVFGSDYSIGSRVDVTCDYGYAAKGKAFVNCGDDGKWDPMPKCKESSSRSVFASRSVVFDPDSCSPPPAPENGYITEPRESFSQNDEVVFQCYHGFDMEGEYLTQCLGSNRYSNPVPKCKARTSCLSGCSYVEEAPCQCDSQCFFNGNCCLDHFVFCNVMFGFPTS